MENASKALIIAGAILLSILLISLGIMIFTQASGVISGSGMTEAEVSAFNQKFTKYEGKRRGSEIRAMVQEVMANNNNEQASAETRVAINVAVTGVTAPVAIPSTPVVKLTATASAQPVYSSFSNTTTYTVDFGYLKGRVALITVVK